ncbi:MAG: hypothetical protein KFF77_07825 [Bacteroidetes bacterium]|nr:hypothetical protein [Bacteroidota bacterium]
MSENLNPEGQGHYTGFVADWYDDFLAGEGEDIRLYVSLLTRYEYVRDGGLIETILDELRLREYSRGEAELLLEHAGFVVESVEQRRVMSTHAVSVLFVCRWP